MHNTDDLDNNWDDLVSEFGLEPDSTKPTDDQHIHVTLPAPTDANGFADDDVEVEEEVSVETSQPTRHAGAMFDPGPDKVEDSDGLASGEDDEFDDTDSPELFDTEAAPTGDVPQEGGKRKRKRRRRKKKKGSGDPNANPETVAQGAPVTEEVVPDDVEAVAVVEEGEAPAEIIDDDDDAPPPSAVDEELVAVANEPKQEWNVMSWNDLIGKLYRPS